MITVRRGEVEVEHEMSTGSGCGVAVAVTRASGNHHHGSDHHGEGGIVGGDGIQAACTIEAARRQAGFIRDSSAIATVQEVTPWRTMAIASGT